MATTPEVAGSPFEIQLKGRKFLMHPFSDQDLGEFENWVKTQRINVAKANLEGLTPDERQRQLDRAFDDAFQLKLTSPAALTLMSSVPGLVKLLWIGIRRSAPKDVNEAWVGEAMLDPETMAYAAAVVDKFNETTLGPLPGSPETKKPEPNIGTSPLSDVSSGLPGK